MQKSEDASTSLLCVVYVKTMFARQTFADAFEFALLQQELDRTCQIDYSGAFYTKYMWLSHTV